MSEEKDLVTVDTSTEELEKRLLNEYDSDEIKNIIDIFNMNLRKKDIIRVAKLSELQDKVSTQMAERITNNADAFNNKDLLEYFKAIQQTISKSDTSPVKIPVQINQQLNVNMQTDSLDRESKSRVLAAIQSILSKGDVPFSQDEEVIDIESEEEEENLIDEPEL